jgi:hypothetical protein
MIDEKIKALENRITFIPKRKEKAHQILDKMLPKKSKDEEN